MGKNDLKKSEDVNFDAIMREQQSLLTAVQKQLINHRKDSAENKTVSKFKRRLEAREGYKKRFYENERQIVNDSEATEAYMEAGLSEQFEEEYIDVFCKIEEAFQATHPAEFRQSSGSTHDTIAISKLNQAAVLHQIFMRRNQPLPPPILGAPPRTVQSQPTTIHQESIPQTVPFQLQQNNMVLQQHPQQTAVKQPPPGATITNIPPPGISTQLTPGQLIQVQQPPPQSPQSYQCQDIQQQIPQTGEVHMTGNQQMSIQPVQPIFQSAQQQRIMQQSHQTQRQQQQLGEQQHQQNSQESGVQCQTDMKKEIKCEENGPSSPLSRKTSEENKSDDAQSNEEISAETASNAIGMTSQTARTTTNSSSVVPTSIQQNVSLTSISAIHILTSSQLSNTQATITPMSRSHSQASTQVQHLVGNALIASTPALATSTANQVIITQIPVSMQQVTQSGQHFVVNAAPQNFQNLQRPLQRFFARRGFAHDSYSDCGTTFIGANK